MSDTRFCRQPGVGLVRVSGRDARKFLHAQTTQRIDDLPPGETRLAAWLNAKGRVLALFDIVPDGDAFLLMLPADNAEPVMTGIRRYVLRDDVRIAPETRRSVVTLVGNVDVRLGTLGIVLRQGAVTVADGTILARTGEQRIDLVADAASLPVLLDGLAETHSDAAAHTAIAAGRPEVPLALVDRYTPHMLNLERLGAVSFNKGCYPGQEIVARTEHRGAVKRRIARFRCGAGPRPAAGEAIVDATGAPGGDVNRVAATANGFEILAVATVDGERESLRLGSDGRTLEALDLPS
jgi:folate-binding protein YgfZ